MEKIYIEEFIKNIKDKNVEQARKNISDAMYKQAGIMINKRKIEIAKKMFGK